MTRARREASSIEVISEVPVVRPGFCGYRRSRVSSKCRAGRVCPSPPLSMTKSRERGSEAERERERTMRMPRRLEASRLVSLARQARRAVARERYRALSIHRTRLGAVHGFRACTPRAAGNYRSVTRCRGEILTRSLQTLCSTTQGLSLWCFNIVGGEILTRSQTLSLLRSYPYGVST